MLSTIKEIFNRNKYDIIDKKEWIDITNCLINEIDIDKYSILKYRQNFDNSLIIENVINHKESHSHSVVYINPKFKLQLQKNSKKIKINLLYPQCISNLWKSNLISTSNFEDKLYYIFSIMIDQRKELKQIEIKQWLNLLYYMKKKSINDVLQKLIWEVYYQIFNIIEPIYVDIDILYFRYEDWIKFHNEIVEKIIILSNKINISQWDVIAKDERKIIEHPCY